LLFGVATGIAAELEFELAGLRAGDESFSKGLSLATRLLERAEVPWPFFTGISEQPTIKVVDKAANNVGNVNI
jgi:hypothetical protein